jgi:Protein of unknown function (DUF2971)
MEKWKRELIRYMFPYSAGRRMIERAFNSKHPHIPSSLYKYRSFSNEHKDAIEKGVLWRSSPNSFNDPYDSVVYFDPNRFFMENQAAEDFDRLLRDASADDRDAILQEIDSWLTTQNAELVRSISERNRAGFSVLALGENATSVLMWSHYSDDHKGFCIEYDLSALPGDDLRRRFCYPVFYRRKLTDGTRYLERMNPRAVNDSFYTYMCLLKSDEWAYEREWRIVYPGGPSRMQMPKPKCVILGVHVQPTDEAWMRTFCKNHRIRLRHIFQRHNEFRLEIRDADMS